MCFPPATWISFWYWKRLSRSLFEWVTLRWLIYYQVFSPVRIFVLITFGSFTFSPHALKFLYFCCQKLGQRYWFWGDETSPSLWAPCGVGGWYLWSHVEKNRTFTAFSIDKVSYFHRLSQVESWNHNKFHQ